MAERSGPPQSARQDALGTLHPSLEPVDSSTPRSAPLSRCTLLRHPSFVRAVCVDALVRLCAGGDQRWSSLPQQLLGQILNFLFADDSETLCVTQFQVTHVWTISLSLLASVE